ncbi:aegerolysin family protein [Actinocrispum wychmicini]|uniref:aegerolysin family protein n=1 Tax=Actinocrispum wychmicini TaxID=1213861 RepID=UPI0014050D7C|nr:aegerolysin family protein [Actinocrispum wychmicini]
MRSFLSRLPVILGVIILAVLGSVSPANAGDARSAAVIINNTTDATLVGIHKNLDHGCWETEPPATIGPHQTVLWKTVSCGFMTGTEGDVDYGVNSKDGDQLHVHWDIPWSGDNSFDGNTSVFYKVTHGGSEEGNRNATTTFTFDCSSQTCDGIPDDWKQHGTTLDPGDGSGAKFIDLPAMGADVSRPDVFLQLDWMADDKHSEKIDPAALRKIVQAFANDPAPNRNGTHGVNLHIDQGPDSVLDYATGRTWGNLSRARVLPWSEHFMTEVGTTGRPDFTDFDNVMKQPGGFVSTGRQKLFHYVISAHRLANIANLGGYSQTIPGSKIALGPWGIFTNGASVDEQAMVLMHELGHDLGLGHGGFEGLDGKPNYISIMNMAYHGDRAITRNGQDWTLDYSRATGPTLDETDLNEPAGLGSYASTDYVVHFCAGGTGWVQVRGDGPIDWNCDGVINPYDPQHVNKIGYDVNDDKQQTSLRSFNDWEHLYFRGGGIGHNSASAFIEQPLVDEGDTAQVLPVDTTAPVTTASVDPPANTNGYNNSDVHVALSATDDISRVARTEYTVDGSGWVGYTGPVPVTGEGVHTVQYRSVDHAQNVEQPRTLTVKIDKHPPVTTATLDPPPNAAGWGASNTTVHLKAADESGGSGVDSVTYSATGANPIAATTVPGATADPVITGEGETTLTYYATDRAGNVESAHTLTIRVDKTAPTSTFTTANEAIFVAVAVGTPPGSDPSGQFVEGTASDPTSGVDKVKVTYTPELLGSPSTVDATVSCTDATRHSCTWKVAPPTGIGRYRVTVSSTDPAGNVEQPAKAIHVTVVRLLPSTKAK